MSKKNYLEPEMEVLELKMTQMICASVQDNGETGKEDGEGGEDDF